jgi:NADPH:quinone reductase-like Zn-dependent oxidoreductase
MSNTGSSTQTMRAWTINAYGEPMRLRDLPLPRPGPNDVLIRMHGAEVGEWDERVRNGKWPMERPFPLALGLAGSGTVTSVGKDVTGFKEDDPVYAYSYPLYDNGAWAEYMLVPESYAAPPPPVLELARAGATPIAGLIAHETLIDILDVRKDEVVLITAAFGGVGHLAVQLARHLEARVIALASHRHAEFVAALDPDTVIDYTAVPSLKEAIHSEYPKGVDKALNGVAGDDANQLMWVMRDGGHIVDLAGAITARRPGVRIDSGYVPRADGARLELVSDLIDEEILRVEIHELFPFDRAPDALAKVLAGQAPGKIGIRIR